jgi:hypothetical protein
VTSSDPTPLGKHYSNEEHGEGGLQLHPNRSAGAPNEQDLKKNQQNEREQAEAENQNPRTA